MAYKRKSPFNAEANAYTDPGTIKTSMPEFSGAPILDIKADGPSKINKEKPHQVTDEELKNDDTMAQNLIDDESTDGGSPMAYLNPNTMEVQGDAGQMDQPNRAGRPVNSNVLMNDPMSYQDPSKMSAQQNQQEQIFSGLASSMGQANPEPMIPGQDPNQSITPGQPAPFNMNGGPGDPPKKGLKKQMKTVIDVPNTTDSTAAYMQNMYNRDYGQGTKGNWSDIAGAAEKRYPGLQKAVGTNPPKGPDGNPNSIDYNVKEGREKYGLSPLKKTGWIQDVNKDIERRGTKGVCTGDKFGSESCPPGSKRYNLAKTFKKMNKK